MAKTKAAFVQSLISLQVLKKAFVSSCFNKAFFSLFQALTQNTALFYAHSPKNAKDRPPTPWWSPPIPPLPRLRSSPTSHATQADKSKWNGEDRTDPGRPVGPVPPSSSISSGSGSGATWCHQPNEDCTKIKRSRSRS